MDNIISKDNSEKNPLITRTIDANDEVAKVKFGKWSYAIVSIILLLHMFSYVLNMYVMNEYAYFTIIKQQYPNGIDESTGDESVCTVNTSSNGYKQQLVVQQLQSRWSIYCTLASNIPSIFISMNIVSYTDAYGRKLFFLAPLLGTMLKSVLCAIGMYFQLGMEWFIPFYFVEGCGGSWIASLALTLCLVSDITVPGKQRSFAIGVMETAFELGSLLSSLLSGYLIKYTKGFLTPVILSEGITVAGVLLVLFILPETLPDEKRRQKTSIFQNMKKVTDFYTTDISSSSNKWLFIIAISIFILTDFSMGSQNVLMLYQLSSPFCWSTVKVGNFGSIMTVIGCIGSVLMIKLFHCCTTDQVIALVSCVTSAVSLIWLGIATSSLMLYLVPVLGIGKSLAMPMMRGIMSKMTPAHRQGSVFGSIAAVEAIVNMTGSVAANAVYGATVGFYRGTAFFVNAGYNVIGFILCIILIHRMKSYERNSEPA